MALYFFHFVSANHIIPDEFGVALSSLDAAHNHAVRLAEQVLPYLEGDDPRGWQVGVADVRGSMNLIVSLPRDHQPLDRSGAASARRVE